MPSANVENYGYEPFSLRHSIGHFFNVQDYELAAGDMFRRSIVRIENGLFRVTGTSYGRVDFDKGVFNFYNPEGTAYPKAYVFFGGSSSRNSGSSEVFFHKDAQVSLPSLYVSGNTPVQYLTADGGTHAVMGAFRYPGETFYAAVNSDFALTVTNGARLSVAGTTTIGRYVAPDAYRGGTDGRPTRRSMRTLVSGAGSKLTFGGDYAQTVAGQAAFDVVDGGEIAFVGSKTDFAADSNVTGTLSVVNAILTTANAFTLGCAGQTNACAHVVLTDATVNTTGGNGTFAVAGGCVEAKDADWDAYQLSIGAGTNEAEVVMDGGTLDLASVARVGNTGCGTLRLKGGSLTAKSQMDVGSATGGDGSLIVEGGEHAVSYLYAANKTGSSGRIEVKDGKLTTPNMLYAAANGTAHGVVSVSGGELVLDKGLTLGNSTGSATFYQTNGTVSVKGANVQIQTTLGMSFDLLDGTFTAPAIDVNPLGDVARLTVSGGLLDLNADAGLILGHSGAGVTEMTVSGGEIRAYQVRLGYYGSAASGTNVLRMTGGKIVLSAQNEYIGLNVADGSTRKGALILDGGEIRTWHVGGGSGAAVVGGTGRADFSANGGKIVAQHASSKFFGQMDSARLGAKGLTLESDYAVTIQQDFSDLPGEEGVLKLTGTGTKTLCGTQSVASHLVIDGGKTVIAPISDVQSAGGYKSISVSAGGILSLAGGQTSIATGDLTLGDGVSAGALELDPSDVVTVTGSLVVNDGAIRLTGDFAEGDHTLISVVGDSSAALAETWSRLRVVSGQTAARIYTFNVTYDASTDRTKVNLKVSPASDVSEARWTGSQSDKWSTAGNWSPSSVPTALSSIVFGQEAARQSVTLETFSAAAALTFDSATGYDISGEGIRLSESSASGVYAARGEHEVESALSMPGRGILDVASGAKVVVSGVFSGDTVVKAGRGGVRLNAGERGIADVVVSNGLFSVRDADLLDDSSVRLIGGTLELGTEEPDEMFAARQILVDDGKGTDTFVFKADSNVSIPAPYVNSGMTLKRGAGRLTFASAESRQIAANEGNSGDWAYDKSNPISFDEDGAPSTATYAAINIAEGDLHLAGTTDGVVYTARRYIGVGMPTTLVGAAVPELSVDHAYLNANQSGRHLMLGAGLTDDNTFASEVRLTVTNGAVVNANTLYLGRNNTRANMRYRVLCDASVLTNSYIVQANAGSGVGSLSEFTIRNGSKFYTPSINLAYRSKLTFDASEFAKNANGDPAKVEYKNGANGAAKAGGDLIFRNGSVFRCSSVDAYGWQDKPTTLTFDDSEWVPGVADYTFVFRYPTQVKLFSEGEGLVLAPPANATWTMATALSGTGDFVKRGAGTVVFDTFKRLNDNGEIVDNTESATVTTLDFAGVARVEEGTLRIKEGASRDGLCVNVSADAVLDLDGAALTLGVVSGSGTIANGTLSGVVPLDVGDDWTVSGAVPTFGLASLAIGRIKFDLGRTDVNPVMEPFGTIVVAHYTGGTPDLSRFRVVGTGLRNVKGVFTAVDGEIRMTLEHTGMLLIVR